MERIKKFFYSKYFIVIALSLLALFVRLINIDKKYGLWYDEMLTYMFSAESFPFGILKTLARYDYHMPLYYFYVHFWIKMFGSNDVILRLSSVLWGVLSVPAFYLLGKTFKSDKLGYLLASIASLSPIMIYYSQEVRFYSMLLFLAIISVIYFLKLLNEQNGKDFLIFSVVNLIILYIYSMGILFVFPEIILLLIHFYLYRKDSFIKFLKFSIIFFAFTIPYLVMLVLNFITSNNALLDPLGWSGKPSFYSIFFVINDLFSPYITCINGYVNINQKMIIASALRNTLVFMFIPTLCFLIGFVLSLFEYSKKMLYLLILLLPISLVEIFWYFQGHFALSAKYLFVIFPIILLICSNGLLLIKSNIRKKICISLIFLVYAFNVWNYKFVTAFDTRPTGLKFATDVLAKLNINKNDYILFPDKSDLLRKYFPNANFIDLDSTSLLYLDKSKQEALKMFDKRFVFSTNKYNFRRNFMPYYLSGKPTPELTNFIHSNIDKMPRGSKLIYIQDLAVPPDESSDFNLFYNKFYKDLHIILSTDKKLKLVAKIDKTVFLTNKTWCFIIYNKL